MESYEGVEGSNSLLSNDPADGIGRLAYLAGRSLKREHVEHAC